MQTALITGGSSGIGLEMAKIMAARGHDLVLVARDAKRLEQTKAELEKSHDVHVETQQADLAQPGSAKKLYDSLKKKNIEILVNNAGVGLVGNFFDNDLDRDTDMVYLNMITLMELTYYFGNDFVKKSQGRILNMGSIAAFFPGPKQPVYYATKAFVRSFSRALAYDLRNSGVTVTVLHPGPTRTSFFKASNAPFFKAGTSPKSVAKLGYKAMMQGRVETTHGLWNRFITNVFVRIVPYRIQTAAIDKASEI